MDMFRILNCTIKKLYRAYAEIVAYFKEGAHGGGSPAGADGLNIGFAVS